MEELLVGDLGEAAAAGQGDLGLAPLGELGGVGAGAGVQQGQPVDPVGGLAGDLEADVAALSTLASRAKRGGAWARIRLAMAAMVGSRVLSAMVCGPCCRRAESWAAYTRGELQQAGDQHDRDRFGHLGRLLAAASSSALDDAMVIAMLGMPARPSSDLRAVAERQVHGR